MLFAIWTENRATDDADTQAATRSSISLHSISRQNSLAAPAASARTNEETPETPIEDKKIEKLEETDTVDLGAYEDGRPAVFKSTWWEICCVISIVCAQLTNVFAFVGLC